MPQRKEKRNRWLFIIAIFKLVKAVLLITLAVGALSVLHKDVAEVVTYRIWQLGFDPNNRYAERVIDLVDGSSSRKIALLSAASFFYAALFAIEGIGLFLEKRWAEYFTAIITASFLPLEIYELAQHTTIFKSLVIVLNVGIVIYLVMQLRRTSASNRAAQGG